MGFDSVVLGHVSLKWVLFFRQPIFGLVLLGLFICLPFIHFVTSGSLFDAVDPSFRFLVICARLSVVLRPL